MGTKKDSSHFEFLQEHALFLLKETGSFTWHSFHVTRAFLPLAGLLADADPVTVPRLSAVLDGIFEALYRHPLTRHGKAITDYLRQRNLIPNEKSTETLIRYLVEQALVRSPVKVPAVVVNEFWNFFDDLFSAPELKGLVELNLDIVRIVLRSYEPLIVEIFNLIKDATRINKALVKDLTRRVKVIRGDLVIIRRQVRALRHIKAFFQTDPADFKTQAVIVVEMVREFGPFFIKLAQVAAANADFLPEEIASELLVFQEDVSPMSPMEVNAAFAESFGKKPYECYFDFNINAPLKSGSIGSAYVAKKPVIIRGQEVLVPVIVKVARSGLDREFLLGRTVLGVAIISSHYWAPHSKLAPFLEAMQQQADEFVKGFQREIDFEQEAKNQKRFSDRSRGSGIWNVPEIYSYSRRIIEMEYIEDATPITRFADTVPEKERHGFARQLASRFLYTVFLHALVYQEFHGDLHPGNVLVDSRGELFLIDWGNCVDLKGKWKPLWDYVYGAICADAERLTAALIVMSTDPERSRKREEEIRSTLSRTLKKKNVPPLTRTFFLQLKREGADGLHRRLQVVFQLMSNTQHLGLVVRSEYLHLSRSLAAITGTYFQLYRGLPRYYLIFDFISTMARFPMTLMLERFSDDRSAKYLNLIRKLPALPVVKKTSPRFLSHAPRPKYLEYMN